MAAGCLGVSLFPRPDSRLLEVFSSLTFLDPRAERDLEELSALLSAVCLLPPRGVEALASSPDFDVLAVSPAFLF